MCSRCNHLASGISELETLFDIISTLPPESQARTQQLASIGQSLAQAWQDYAAQDAG